MEKHTRHKDITVTDDGNLCAFIADGYLKVYNVTKKVLLCKVKRSNSSETKALKFSPSKESVAWINSPPNELVIAVVQNQKISAITGHSEFPFLDILWSPDGKTLAAFSSLSVFIDVYTVDQEQTSHVASVGGAQVNELGQPLAQFSPDGEYFATVNVSTQGYSVTIYSCDDSAWECVQRIVCSDSHDVGGLLWCPDSTSLLVWQAGPTMHLRLWTADGTVERSLAADDARVSCVCLSDCGRVAAVLTADCKVRILDLLTWRLDMTEILIHCPIIHKASARRRLRVLEDSSKQVSNCETITSTLYELHQNDTSSHRQIAMARFSVEGQFLATYVASYPSTLWVWRLVDKCPLDTVVVLSEETTVKELLWHKEEVIFCADLSDGGVLVWTPEKAVVLKHTINPWPFTAQEYLASVTSEELLETSK